MGFWKTLSNLLRSSKSSTIVEHVEPEVQFKAHIIDDDIVEYEILTGPDAGKKIRLMRATIEDRNTDTAESDFE